MLTACSGVGENEFELKGSIDKSLDGKNALLQKNGPMGLIPIDTVKIEGGKFVFEGKVEAPEIHYVTVEGVQNVGLDFILENGSIELAIDKDSLQKSNRGGTYNNEKLQEYVVENTKWIKKIETDQNAFREKNMAAYMAAQTAKDEATMQKLTDELLALERKKTEYSSQFIDKNPKAYVSLLLIKQYTGSANLPYEDLVKKYEALDPELKKLKEGKEISDALVKVKESQETQNKVKQNAANTEVGKMAPQFSAPGPDGKTISLKDAMGKVTLIDFWASWCGPCRQENPNVVAMYNELHSKGLNIIGVSLDRPKEGDKWKKAIADDKLTWAHVSNLMEWNDPIAQQYGVQGIPATFLLDASGKIVAKNLRGEELKAKVKELLSK